MNNACLSSCLVHAPRYRAVDSEDSLMTSKPDLKSACEIPVIFRATNGYENTFSYLLHIH
jgi:hypothetical protein